MMGRLLLPSYGGGFYVWTACLLFFQGVLFLGYLYSHVISSVLGRWHLLVVLFPVVQLPLAVSPQTGASILWDVTLTLFSSVSLVFGVLATTSVTTQLWLTKAAPKEDPYPLYAASNLGSLLALISYPFLWEPFFGLATQRLLWSAGYLLYIGTTFASYPWKAKESAKEPPKEGERPTKGAILIWLVLSAAASMFSMAVTNVVTLDIGSAPFIWVLLLGIYIGTFILAFRGFYPKVLRLLFPYVAGAGLFFFYVRTGLFWVQLLVQLCVLFWVCLVATAETYEQRPSSRYLTRFYLLVSLGGWLGGLFVTLFAPLFFTGFAEYPLSLVLISGVVLWLRRREVGGWLRSSSLVGRVALFLFFALLGLFLVRWLLFLESDFQTIKVLRNSYGVYWIYEAPYQQHKAEQVPGAVVRTLMHGTTVHGAERVDGPDAGEPLSYYHRSSPIGRIFARLSHPNKVAAIGLGAGAVAAYSTSVDQMTFYELDPDDITIAREEFTYLKRAPHVKTIAGDARLQLERDPEARDGSFDVIFVDAFTSDAIPTHLLTQEALSLYLQKLKPEGLLLIHISNRYYDLRPVLLATGDTLGLSGAYAMPKEASQLAPLENPCAAYALSRDPSRLTPLLQSGWEAATTEKVGVVAPWSDDYVNVLAPLWKKFLSE